MINETVVELSRLQFASTALYHFLFVPLTLGLSFLLAAMETVYFVSNRPDLQGDDPVLEQALPDQFRTRRRDRTDHGVPVRHQLVFLLHLRRRYVRRASRHRGSDGVLHGVDLRRLDDIRLGSLDQGAASDRHLFRRAGLQLVRAVDPDCQQLHAESAWCPLQSADHASGAGQLHGNAVQSGCPVEVRSYQHCGLRDRRHLRRGDQRLLHAQQSAYGAGQALVPDGRAVRCALDRGCDHAGRRAGLRRRARSADQACRDGGAVDDGEAADGIQRGCHPLAGRAQEYPGHTDPGCAFAPRNALTGRYGSRSRRVDATRC